MLGRATLRIVLSSEMTSRATETTSSVHQRRSWMLLAVADMLAPPRITIRDGVVSLLKHSRAIYATPTLRIYVALLTVALCGAGAAAADAAQRPWRVHVRDAAEYAADRAGTVSFGVRTGRGFEGRGRTDRALRQRRQGDAARRLSAAAGRPAPKAARGRARPSRPDDSAFGQRRCLQVCNIVGYPIRPWGLNPSTWPARRASSSTSNAGCRGVTVATRCGCCARSCPRSAGASHAPARADGRSTSRAAGAPAPAGWTTRWRCCVAAAAAWRWRS